MTSQEVALQEIHQLKFEYCSSVDDGDWNRFRGVFLDDFELGHSRYGDVISDEEEMEEWFEWRKEHYPRDGEDVKLDNSTHIAVNPQITFIDESTAEGKWYYLVFVEFADGDVEFGVGDYDDIYRKVDNEWKVARTDAIRRHGITIQSG